MPDDRAQAEQPGRVDTGRMESDNGHIEEHEVLGSGLPFLAISVYCEVIAETYDTYCAQQVELQVVSNSLAIGNSEVLTVDGSGVAGSR